MVASKISDPESRDGSVPDRPTADDQGARGHGRASATSSLTASTRELTRKTCTRCGDRKHLDGFSRNRMSRDGHARICKTCYAGYDARQKYERNLGIALARVAAALDVHGGER